jgi:hypothetical protein
MGAVYIYFDTSTIGATQLIGMSFENKVLEFNTVAAEQIEKITFFICHQSYLTVVIDSENLRANSNRYRTLQCIINI